MLAYCITNLMECFFGEDGLKKYFTTERGYEWTGGETFDDLVS